MDELVLAGRRFTSRLVVGTGKYKDFPTMSAAPRPAARGWSRWRCAGSI